MYKMPINIAIVGAGNCANSLYQGLHYYENNFDGTDGLMKHDIGGYTVKDVCVVAAFDVDRRKVGVCFRDAILSKPNCTPIFYKHTMREGPIVMMGTVLDGISSIMENYSEDQAFRVSDETPVNIVQVLKDCKADILINYLPVGSEKATEFYANACIEARVAFLNCIPVFIASDPVWEQKFIKAGLPLVGDDMKSQFGASILSQMLQELAISRGHCVKCHIQRNVGGNTDFLNMSDQTRVISKKKSKENVIRSQHEIHGLNSYSSFLHAGPSEYIKYYEDNKIANIHIEMSGFMGTPVVLDAQLSVIDSPNSAGVVIDAIRYLKVAKELNIVGSLRGPSAFTQKSPPVQMTFAQALEECNALAERKITKINKENLKVDKF